MLQALRKNFGLKLFSLALAVGGWAYFRFLAGPSISAPFGIGFGADASAVTQRSFALSVAYSSPNGSIVAQSVDVTPNSVSITAPAYAMARIRAIHVDVPVPTEATTYDAMVAPQVDADGVAPALYDVSPNLVRVHVSFARAST